MEFFSLAYERSYILLVCMLTYSTTQPFLRELEVFACEQTETVDVRLFLAFSAGGNGWRRVHGV